MTLADRQAAIRARQKPRRGWKLGRRRFKLARLRWWMSIQLQTYSPQEVARMVRDELKIEPEDIRRFVIDRRRLLTPSE